MTTINIVDKALALPTVEDANLAHASASELSRLLTSLPKEHQWHMCTDGHDLILPRQAVELLCNLLTEMAQGHAVAILPVPAELSTEQAANMLNVSRPFMMKLLEEQKIPFTKAGIHRRIHFHDLMTYKRKSLEQSARLLEELAEVAQELGVT